MLDFLLAHLEGKDPRDVLIDETSQFEPTERTPIWLRYAFPVIFLICMGIIMKGGL